MSRKEEIQKLLDAKRAFESGDSLIRILDEIFKFKGSQGEQGNKGDKGEQGVQGIPGRNGKDGKDGKNGKDGLRGFQGIRGERGEKGELGKNGKDAPFKKEFDISIIEKLEEKIENVKKLVRNVQRTKGSKGGGMGDVIADTPTGTIDGSNRTFTLSFTPKTNAIWLNANGQPQRLGIDFTISGRIITMQWDIPTGGDIFVIGIR